VRRRSLGVTAGFAALGASILWCAGAKADSPLLPACDPTSVRYDIIQCDETYGLNNLPAVCNPQNSLYDKTQCYLSYGPDDGRDAPSY
jgi:hypothetical protein